MILWLKYRAGHVWCRTWHRGEMWKLMTTGANSEKWYCRLCGRSQTLKPAIRKG